MFEEYDKAFDEWLSNVAVHLDDNPEKLYEFYQSIQHLGPHDYFGTATSEEFADVIREDRKAR